VNESNFQDRLLNFKTVSHIGAAKPEWWSQVSRPLDLAPNTDLFRPAHAAFSGSSIAVNE